MMAGTKNNLKFERTKSLFLYICHKMEEEKGFDSIVLNKVFYYIDNIWYQKHKQIISCFTYVKQKAGPTPKPAHFMVMRSELVESEQLKLVEHERIGRIKNIPKALVVPNMEMFKPEEIVFIDEIIDAFRGLDGATVSQITHGLPAWKAAQPLEELPYHTFFITEGELTEEDVDWALTTIQARNNERGTAIA